MRNSVLIVLATLAVAAAQKGQGADGNPHGWDRKRRCDHVDYHPICGPCEGVGGIPTGDDNAAITLTSCTALANSSQVNISTLVRPVWAKQWTTRTYEILIGPKTDPFCFQAFPSNSSAGKLCYRKQTGTQVYDFTTARALREDIQIATPLGNVTSTVLHQGTNFWVINKFPWYAAGIHQCICTKVRDGGPKAPHSAKLMYPVSTNWTDNLHFVARENIGIEYDQGNHTLNHWAFGPHHVWTDVLTGRIRRMWQPFNGLQIFISGTSTSPVDPALFAQIPPPLCKKKGGATFRIKCSDEGLPTDPNTTHALSHTDAANTSPATATGTSMNTNVNANTVAGTSKATGMRTDTGTGTSARTSQMTPNGHTDESRARTMVPRHGFRGDTFASMSTTLNKWLTQRLPGRPATATAPGTMGTKPCGMWNVTELHRLQAMLYLARDTSFDDIYQSAQDNRRLVRPDLEAIQQSWEGLKKTVAAAGEHADKAHDVLRDGHCHEAVMWFTHHLTEDVKKALTDGEVGIGLTIPLLSLARHDCRKDPTVPKSVCKAYEDRVTCASCHSDSPK